MLEFVKQIVDDWGHGAGGFLLGIIFGLPVAIVVLLVMSL